MLWPALCGCGLFFVTTPAPSIAADPLGLPALHFVLPQSRACSHHLPYQPLLRRFHFNPPFLLFPPTLSLLLPPSVETSLQ